MYHVAANLEGRFNSVDEALRFYTSVFEAKVPKTRSPGEDAVTPRICVAPTIEDCMSGIGLLGRLRRCLGGNDGAYSYAVAGNEIYPIIIVEFSKDEDYYKPTIDEVPDVDITNEYWIRYDALPISVRLVWLDMYSIKWKSEDKPEICKQVEYYDIPPNWGNHPWINGKGHKLDCSEQEEYSNC